MTPSTASEEAAHPDRWTLLDVLRWTTKRFQDRGLPTARLDAEVLIAAALRLKRVELYVQFERPLDPPELGSIRELVRRRQNGECVAYLVGHKEFFGLEFVVDPRVLVPRPDTETLVDEVLARLQEHPLAPGHETGHETGHKTGHKIADIGTGSGAILVTLGKNLPDPQLFGVDVSSEALAVAQINAEHHRVTATWLCGDLTLPLAGQSPFDVIVANLPYVPTGQLSALAHEVRNEPQIALDGGLDGLGLLRRLIAAAPALLAPGGCLALEIGAGQADATLALCRAAGFTDLRARRDLGTVERVVSGLRPTDPSVDPTP